MLSNNRSGDVFGFFSLWIFLYILLEHKGTPSPAGAKMFSFLFSDPFFPPSAYT